MLQLAWSFPSIPETHERYKVLKFYVHWQQSTTVVRRKWLFIKSYLAVHYNSVMHVIDITKQQK